MAEKPDLLKLKAADQAAFAQSARSKLIEETSASARWLMASLLTLNGVAANSVLDSSLISISLKFIPLGMLFFGTLAALSMAFFGQIANKAMINPINAANFFWIEIAAGETFDESRWKEIESDISKAMRKTGAVKIAGLCSAIMFTIGCVAASLIAVIMS